VFEDRFAVGASSCRGQRADLEDPRRDGSIAKAHACSPARLSLAWLLAKPVVTSVIGGAKRLDQLQHNLAAVELTLTQDELRQLDEVSALAPEYPGWVLPFQGADRASRSAIASAILRPVACW
jgi:diketogulonate reductase-like aldo/keto reductase